jgi:hypothetical protein
LDTKGITPEVLPNRLNFYLLQYLVFFFFFFCIINFTITIFLFLFISPVLQSICSPSQLLFLPLLIHSLPVFTSPSYHSPTCRHTTPPSYTLSSLLYQQYIPQDPASSDTSTLHYNNRHIPKHTQGQQNPAAPILLIPHTHPIFALPFLVPPLPITQVSIASPINIIPPNSTVYRYYHQGVSI